MYKRNLQITFAVKRVRQVVAYREFFLDFLKSLPERLQNKVFKVIEIIETIERVPEKYLKRIRGTSNLYEARIQLGKNIWRVFCFFDEDRLVILLNGFVKKSNKTPKKEIAKALSLQKDYYNEKPGR